MNWLLACIVFLACVAVDLVYKDQKKRESQPIRPPYVTYETHSSIADVWYDRSLVGECSKCGLDDAPLIVPSGAVKDSSGRYMLNEHVAIYSGDGQVINNPWMDLKCKWCAEKDNINYHLKYKNVSPSTALIHQAMTRPEARQRGYPSTPNVFEIPSVEPDYDILESSAAPALFTLNDRRDIARQRKNDAEIAHIYSLRNRNRKA